MGLSTMANSFNTSICGSVSPKERGMGLLVVFFPEVNNSIADNSKLLHDPSPSSTKSPIAPSFRRSNSNALLSKAQSTISVCALLFFVTLLLFTLSTFEPTVTYTAPNLSQSTTTARRFLSQKPHGTHIRETLVAATKTHYWFTSLERTQTYNAKKSEAFPSTALQGVGNLYRRGTRAMSDLIVGHVVEDITDDELRLFLRLIHRSGLTARADIALIFAPTLRSLRFASIIEEENNSFSALVQHYRELKLHNVSNNHRSNFNVEHFFKLGKKENETLETLWGKRTRSNITNPNAEESESDELSRSSYGSILSFDVTELDPENTLSGFLDHIPMSLRRWACYPMLLGRVKRNFKHIMLVDVKNLLVVSDPLNRVRNGSPDSVCLYSMPQSTKHSKKNSYKSHQSHHSVTSAIVMGGARGIRRLSNTVLTEIVRAAMQHKKSSITESGILSQLVGNQHSLKNVHLITSVESIPDTGSLDGHRSSLSPKSLSEFTIIQRGNTNYDVNSVLLKQTCSFDVDSSIYQDCQQNHENKKRVGKYRSTKET